MFGASSDEYLSYATMNRSEWKKKGKAVVADYVKKYQNQDVVDSKNVFMMSKHISETVHETALEHSDDDSFSF